MHTISTPNAGLHQLLPMQRLADARRVLEINLDANPFAQPEDPRRSAMSDASQGADDGFGPFASSAPNIRPGRNGRPILSIRVRGGSYSQRASIALTDTQEDFHTPETQSAHG